MKAEAGLLLVVALALPAAAQDSKNIRDWSVGCDNLRDCTALGMPAEEDGGSGIYVKITRGGEPDAEPEVTFVAYADEAQTGATLTLAFDPPNLGGLPPGPLPTKADDNGFLRASLTGVAAGNFIAAAQKGTGLTVTVTGPDAPAGDDAVRGTISLAGATGSFLYMDDMQNRVGTTTALKAVGGKAVASIPPAPNEPAIAATRLEPLADPLPPLPAALAKQQDEGDCGEGPEPIAIRLSPSMLLWGVCSSAGAYNFSYDFSIEENGGALRPALFELPAALGEAGATLTNPAVSEDGLTLSEFDKGRGIGDCGVSAAWAFDGHAFRLVSYAAMDDCSGIVSDDWPVLYRARVR